MMKKYTIELNERQARLLSYACDQFARLIQGQDAAFQDLMEMAWEKRCKNATGNMMDKEWDDGWYAMREEAERTCLEIKRKFWGLPANTLNGIHYDDTADILVDIHQVIRHELWKNRPEPKSHMIVDAFPATRFSEEPLCTVTSKDEFYLTRPMRPDYVPVTKTFQESASWGVLESTVYFKESR